MPQGDSTDSNRIYLYVNITDNDGGVTTYNFPSPVVVNPNTTLLNTIIQQFSSTPVNVQAVTQLLTGDSQTVQSNIISICSALNSFNLTADVSLGF
jgi:hypothetical protein